MKKSIVLIILNFFCLNLFSQSQTGDTKRSNINVNDTVYLRISNGIIIRNNHSILDFERVVILSKQNSLDLGFAERKPVMLITQVVPTIEHAIDSILYSRPEFIKNYKYPLDIRLPISINNKLISNDEKWNLLAELTLNDIKKIEYLDNKHLKVNRNINPFGVINLEIKKKLKNR